MDSIKQKAEAFARSYAAAMEQSLVPNHSRSAVAEALASHYKPGFTSFCLGSTFKFEDAWEGATAAKAVEKHLENLQKAGFGYKVRMAEQSSVPYSATCAQCWITWEIVEPENGIESWTWTNIYGFRLLGTGTDEKGCFEYAVSDNEIEGLLQRCPKFFEL